MSEGLVTAIAKIGDLLLQDQITQTDTGHPLTDISLQIPEYQRPYKWTLRNVNQLLDDILEAKADNRKVYRLGTLILHRDEKSPNILNIVDGQQRVITFSLLLSALGEQDVAFLKQKLPCNPHNLKNISRNFRGLQQRIDTIPNSALQQDLLRYVKEHCELIVIITDDISEAFQFFDSQNSRGKKLYPHDLLKAYHLREMKDLNPSEIDRTVMIWEDMDQVALSELFQDIFRLKKWLQGNRSQELTEQNMELFKGISHSDNYPYAQFYKGAYSYVDSINHSSLPFVTGIPALNPFQLDTPVVAGKPFFEYAKHYFDVLTDLRSNDNFEGRLIGSNEIIQTLDLRKYQTGKGNMICRLMLDIAILLYVDRFCPACPQKQDLEWLTHFLNQAFLWAYSLRAQITRLGWVTAENFIQGTGNREILNSFNLYKIIVQSSSPAMLFSKLTNLLQPLPDEVIAVKQQDKVAVIQEYQEGHAGSDVVHQDYLYYFLKNKFWRGYHG